MTTNRGPITDRQWRLAGSGYQHHIAPVEREVTLWAFDGLVGKYVRTSLVRAWVLGQWALHASGCFNNAGWTWHKPEDHEGRRWQISHVHTGSRAKNLLTIGEAKRLLTELQQAPEFKTMSPRSSTFRAAMLEGKQAMVRVFGPTRAHSEAETT
jgi:hypothetical protein